MSEHTQAKVQRSSDIGTLRSEQGSIMTLRLVLRSLPWLIALGVFLLTSGLLVYFGSSVRAQVGTGRITLIKDATHADGTDFSFHPSGNFLLTWGSQGALDGEFYHPDGLAVDANGNVYVGDTNMLIQKFDINGNFITKWGGVGSGDGEFGVLLGITVDASGNVYAVDYGNSRIQKFDDDGTFITKWGTPGSGDGQFSGPRDVAVDASGNVYVTDLLNGRIQKFDGDGNFITKWGTLGGGDGQFDGAYGLAISASGKIYVSDHNRRRIQVFDSEGNFITQWGSSGSSDGQFDNPRNVAVDMLGNVYVSDSGNNRIQVFDSEGNFITKWGTPGNGDGQFNIPKGIKTDKKGNVFVVDSANMRVQRFLAATIVLDDALPDDGDAYTSTVVTDVPPGTYVFTESLPSGWALGGVACSDPAGTPTGYGVAINLAISQEITCTFANVPLTQTLTVNQVVVGGGPLDADDFPLFINGNGVTRGAANLLAAGAYSVTETGDPRYTATFGGACDNNGQVTLGSGDHLTCTITNAYIAQTLTVNKVVVGGGPLDADDFPLFINGNGVTRGAANLLEDGSYTVSETGDPRYTAVIGGACNAAGTVTLGIGAHLTCVITNTLIPIPVVPLSATLRVTQTVGGRVPGAPWLFNLSGATDAFSLDPAGSSRSFSLDAGNYTLTAMPKPGFATTVACTNDANGANQVSLALSAGEQVGCTFTSTRLPLNVEVTQTIGLQPDVCAASSTLSVLAGTVVYPCITLHNTSEVTLTQHTITGPLLGVFEFNALVPPDGTLTTLQAGLTLSATIATTTTNAATWSAASADGESTQATSLTIVNIQPAQPVQPVAGLMPSAFIPLIQGNSVVNNSHRAR